MAATNEIYLDNAAATPIDTEVLAAMQPYFTDKFYNPSATYQAARSVKQAVNEARAKVAHYFGARPAEIIFTAGGTEANNLVIHGVMQNNPNGNVVVSAIEHDSVLRPAQQYDVRIAPVLPDGRIDLDALESLIDDNTALVSIQYVNNEIGTIQPLSEIARLIAKKRAQRPATPLLLHTDACQAAGLLDIHVARLGVDFMTINSGKIYGPKQVGALFVAAGTTLHAQILGGGQEQGHRSGTENVPGIIGFAKALTLVQDRRHEEAKRLAELQQIAIRLLAEKLPSAQLNGSTKHRLANNIHITIPGTDNETLMMQLDEKGIMCAVGSACSASNEEPSHVLKAIGLTDADAQASLRFSMGKDTTEADIRRLIDTLAELVS